MNQNEVTNTEGIREKALWVCVGGADSHSDYLCVSLWLNTSGLEERYHFTLNTSL